jgi:hypothetical protein
VSRGFPASSPTCTAAPNLKLHMQHSLVCLWSAACYNSNPFFNNNQRQSLCISIIPPGCNFPRELIIRPPAATTATASCTARNLLNSRKSANKKKHSIQARVLKQKKNFAKKLLSTNQPIQH